MTAKRRNCSPLVSISTIAAAHLPPEMGSESTVRTWVSSGRLPSVRVGKRRLVKREDVAKLLGVSVDDLLAAEAAMHAEAPSAA